jgi:DNA-binding NarL/FixJ family response regulator
MERSFPGGCHSRYAIMEEMKMLKILIVDDNKDYRNSMRELLRERYPFMSVEQAETIDEAKRKLAEFRQDLIFIDIKLGQENGLDLASFVRTAYPAINMAVITSSDFPEYRQAAYEHGAHYFIPKGHATSADILHLIESIDLRKPPQWALGAEYLNPASAGYRRK